MRRLTSVRAVSLGCAVVLVGAAVVFVVRHRGEMARLPESSPGEVAMQDTSDRVAQAAVDRVATAELQAQRHDAALKSRMLERVRGELATVYSTDFDSVRAWRRSWGPSLVDWSDDERQRHAERLTWAKERFETVSLDWDASQFFWVRREGRMTPAPFKGYHMSVWDLTHQETHRAPNRAELRAESDVIAVKVPARYPEEISEPREGFLMLYLSNGTPTGEWQIFRTGCAVPAYGPGLRELYAYRPAVK